MYEWLCFFSSLLVNLVRYAVVVYQLGIQLLSEILEYYTPCGKV